MSNRWPFVLRSERDIAAILIIWGGRGIGQRSGGEFLNWVRG